MSKGRRAWRPPPANQTPGPKGHPKDRPGCVDRAPPSEKNPPPKEFIQWGGVRTGLAIWKGRAGDKRPSSAATEKRKHLA